MTLLTMAYRRNVPRCCAISACTKLDVFRREVLGDPPLRVETMTVRPRPGTREVRANRRAPPEPKRSGVHEHMANFERDGMVAIYASVVIAFPKRSNSFLLVTDYRAVNNTIEPLAMSMPTWKTKHLRSRARPHGAR